MILSHSKKFIFIHLQRTGGTSLSQFFLNHKDINAVQISEHGNAKTHIQYPLTQFKDYFIFGFVRNPWDRLFSWYALLNQDQEESIEIEKQKFELFLIDQFTKSATNNSFFFNQLDYFKDNQNNLVTDKIYQFEAYNQAIKSICKKCNISENTIKKLNATPKTDYRKFYTSKSKKFVAATCKQDIAYFNYVF